MDFNLLDSIIDIQDEIKEIKQIIPHMFDTSHEQETSPVRAYPGYLQSRCVNSSCWNGCAVCIDTCPFQALSWQGNEISKSDACVGCGACIARCPGQALSSSVLDYIELVLKVCAASRTYKTCYISCERLFEGKEIPSNVVVVPCLSALPFAWWLYVLSRFENLSVYLEPHCCSACELSALESLYMEEIQKAEDYSSYSLGLEINPGALDVRKKQSVKRQEFLFDTLKGTSAASHQQAVSQEIQDIIRSFVRIEDALREEWSAQTHEGKERRLTETHALLLASLLQCPQNFSRLLAHAPVWNASLCTGCMQCVEACQTGALEMSCGHVRLATAFCVGCEACCDVCEDKALTMDTMPFA